MMSPSIVTLLPSATEITAQLLSERGQLMAVTHECDYPVWVKSLPKIVRPADPALITKPPAEVDRLVSASLKEGQSLYVLDEELLRRLKPEIIITQRLCDVCTVSASQVQKAIANLADPPLVVELSPMTLGDVLEDVRRVGLAIGERERAEIWRNQLRHRLQEMRQVTVPGARPKVLALEWADPCWAAGHWVPEMIALAGGYPVAGSAGEPSRRLSWEEIQKENPDVLILMCCGYDIESNSQQLALLQQRPGWEDLSAVQRGRVFAVDANAFFSRSSPRLVEGQEILMDVVRDFDRSPQLARRLLGRPATASS